MKSPYLEDILRSARRVLTLLDRNPLGPTQGLFTRSYWHFRTSDFPSASDQMGLGILAKLWCLEGTEYYRNPQLLRYACQAIRALQRIQKDDGSFDEWYFNERGWAGPTGYVMNAALDAYADLKDHLPEEDRRILEKVIRRGTAFLCASQEGHVLANHLAIVILPLVQAKRLLGMNELTPVIEKVIRDFGTVWHGEEGWSVEYDGADPGYQSGTLSFLAKALLYEDHPQLREICEASLEFISHFTFPSGAVGGALGSRHTVTYFCAGIEAFRHTPLGARLSTFMEQGLFEGNVVLASDLDDHYMIYRLYELLDAHRFSLRKERHPQPQKLPWERENFRQRFPQAGMEVGLSGEMYWAVSLKRGGALRVENVKERSVLALDAGVFASARGKLYSSLWQGDYTLKSSDDCLNVRGHLADVTPKIFNPLKLIVFRLFCLLTGFHHAPSLWTKNMIRRLLMVNNKKTSHAFERSIRISEEGVTIETTLVPGHELEEVCIGGEFWTRYVPQSRHFLREHLTSSRPYETHQNVRQTLSLKRHIGS